MPIEESDDISDLRSQSLGPVRRFFDTPVYAPDNAALAADTAVRRDAEADALPLPPTAEREGYHDDRHFEYWLSGRRDALSVFHAMDRWPSNPALLDLGGATGRVIRHMPSILQTPCSCLIADVSERHVTWVNHHLAPGITAFQTRPHPPLPLPDHALDAAFAFSVFTHIYEYEMAWLLELKRVLKPSGLLYVTIHDDQTWQTMEQSVFHPWFTSTPEYRRAKEKMPMLDGRLQFTFDRRNDTRVCNVFHSHSHIRRLWSIVFSIEKIEPLKHDHQAGVTMRA